MTLLYLNNDTYICTYIYIHLCTYSTHVWWVLNHWTTGKSLQEEAIPGERCLSQGGRANELPPTLEAEVNVAWNRDWSGNPWATGPGNPWGKPSKSSDVWLIGWKTSWACLKIWVYITQILYFDESGDSPLDLSASFQTNPCWFQHLLGKLWNLLVQ